MTRVPCWYVLVGESHHIPSYIVQRNPWNFNYALGKYFSLISKKPRTDCICYAIVLHFTTFKLKIPKGVSLSEINLVILQTIGRPPFFVKISGMNCKYKFRYILRACYFNQIFAMMITKCSDLPDVFILSSPKLYEDQSGLWINGWLYNFMKMQAQWTDEYMKYFGKRFTMY